MSQPLALLLAALACLQPGPPAASAAAQDAGSTPAQNAADEVFVCPPCGAECHFTTTSPKGGACGVCGMGLVPLASVPQVGVLLFPRADLTSATSVLGVLARSNATRAFTVADVAEPLRLADTLEVRPQFGFADAPRLDVLVIPDGHGAWEDELVVEWVKAAAGNAQHVLAVGSASVVLARAGFLAGERVPATGMLARAGTELAPGLEFDGTLRARHTGKFRLVRDLAAAQDAALEVVRDLAGEERARRTAEDLGLAWTPEAR
jgi:transcriptional regulator GlxA family with amidase domain